MDREQRKSESRARLAAAATEARPAAAWAELPGGVLDGGEIVIFAIRPSVWRPAFAAGGWVVAACLLASLLLWFQRPLPGLSLLLTAQVLVVAGLIPLGVAIGRWIATWYVLTNRRVLTVEGVRAPQVYSSPLVDIRNTYLTIAPVERVLGVGTITFVTSEPADPPRRWASVSRPQEVHEHIRRAIEHAIDSHSDN